MTLLLYLASEPWLVMLTAVIAAIVMAARS